MLQKVGSLFRKAKSGLSVAFASLSLFCMSTLAMAAGESRVIAIEDSGIDWTTLPGQLIEALMGPVIVAIGIGLSIWAVMIGIRLFRRNSA